MKITPHLPPGLPPAENDKLRQVARSFEALFVNQLVTAMRNTVVKGGLVPEGQGEKVYQSMLDSEYAQKISQSDQIGLSKLIYQQLIRGRLGE